VLCFISDAKQGENLQSTKGFPIYCASVSIYWTNVQFWWTNVISGKFLIFGQAQKQTLTTEPQKIT